MLVTRGSVMFISFYNTDSNLADVAVVVAVAIKRRKRKPRIVWVKPWLEKRSELGVFKLCCFSFLSLQAIKILVP